MATLRSFEPGDLPTLQRIRAAAFAPVFRSFRDLVGDAIGEIAFATAEAEQAKLLDDICAVDSGHHVLTVTEDGEVIGFVSFTMNAETRTGEIGLNALDPAHAGRGVGAEMYAHVLAEMKAHGMALATVGVGGDASHAAARRAYQKAGFGPAIPSLWLYKRL